MNSGVKQLKASIIITTFNQQQATNLVLESINYQKNIEFSDVEIIVVDDGSIFPYKPIETKAKLKLVRQSNKGRSAARNAGIKAASGPLLIFVDGDRVLDDLFIYSYITNFRDGINVGSVCEIYCRDLTNFNLIKDKIDNNQNRTPYYIFSTSVLYDEHGESNSDIIWITTFSGNMCILKETIEYIGLFDESFENWGFEHFELGYRLHKAKIPFYSVNAINYHLAHPRDMDEMKKNVDESISHFTSIHNDIIIDRFRLFLEGKISLQELESNKQAAWLDKNNNKIFMKLGNRSV